MEKMTAIPRKTWWCSALALLLMFGLIGFYFACKKYAPPKFDGALHIVDRIEWHGEPPKSAYERLQTPIKNVVICHTATEPCDSEEVCTYRMRIIQRFHMESLGWSDIGYNFLVGGDGHVYVARGWDTQGQHIKGYGPKTLSIAFIGTFTQKVPARPQIVAAKRLMSEGVRLHKLHPDYHIYAARQLSATESPGAAFYKMMKGWARWSNDVEHLSHNNNATLKIIAREYWLAQPAQKELTDLKSPVMHVVLQSTMGEACSTQAQCTLRVREMQTKQIESLQQPDIIYNFLIGGDGNVYEGRGWSQLGASSNTTTDSISVAYIGTFETEPPVVKQNLALTLFLAEAERTKKLAANYKISDMEKLKPAKSLPMISRNNWLAQPPQDIVQLLMPPINRVLMLSTRTEECKAQSECIFRVRLMQTYDFEGLQLNDIRYNFLIGGDGNIYEGRGWHGVGATDIELKQNLLVVAFIGTFKKQAPNEQQLQLADSLLAEGVRLRIIARDYELIGAEEKSAPALYASLAKSSHWKGNNSNSA